MQYSFLDPITFPLQGGKPQPKNKLIPIQIPKSEIKYLSWNQMLNPTPITTTTGIIDHQKDHSDSEAESSLFSPSSFSNRSSPSSVDIPLFNNNNKETFELTFEDSEVSAVEAKIPTIIKFPDFPVLKISRRHHHNPYAAQQKLQQISMEEGSLRSQGRPFSSFFKLQFLIHASLSQFLDNLTGGNNKRYDLLTIQDLQHFDQKQLARLFERRKRSLRNHDEMKQYRIKEPRTMTVVYEPDNAEDNVHDALTWSLSRPSSSSTDINTSNNKINSESPQLVFLKVIRNNGGKWIKFETVIAPLHYNSEWLKRKICFPRYKADMKIHVMMENTKNAGAMVRKPTIAYHDIRMLMWDMENQDPNYFKNKSILLIP